VTAMQFGRGPSILAAALSVASYNFFFVEPTFTFAVADARYLLTFAVLFAFLIAHRRSSLTFLPLRDAAYFILSRDTVYQNGGAPASLDALRRMQDLDHAPIRVEVEP